MDPLGQLQLVCGVPASSVEHQQNVVLRPDADGVGELSKWQLEDLGGDRRKEEPERLTIFWPDERVGVEPLVAWVLSGDGPTASAGPRAAEDRLEPEPRLVLGPNGQPGDVSSCQELSNTTLESPFLKARWAFLSARRWAGRGRRSVKPIRWR